MRALLVLALALGVNAQDKEAALGERVAAQIRARTTPADSAVQAYVEALARRLMPPGISLRFEVVRENPGGKLREPVWAPGHVFVPEALLTASRTEAELAGMLALAMVEAGERRPDQVIVVGPDGPNRGAGAYARADGIAAAAGYDPAALMDYISREQPEQETSRTERIAAMRQEIASQPVRTEWIESSAAFQAAQERARAELAGPPARRPSLFPRDR